MCAPEWEAVSNPGQQPEKQAGILADLWAKGVRWVWRRCGRTSFPAWGPNLASATGNYIESGGTTLTLGARVPGPVCFLPDLAT